jgi:hypothetical protein
MYWLYERTPEASRLRYRSPEKTSLFGRQSGLIPRLLRLKLPSGRNEPFAWQLDMPRDLAESGHQNKTVIIDVKPKEQDAKLSLYELLDVWGYSDKGWTPVMMRLRGLFIDGRPLCVDTKEFVYDPKNAVNPIFSVMYLNGSVANGDLVKKWTPPGPSSTNGVLMWPEVMKYFSAEAARIMATVGA